MNSKHFSIQEALHFGLSKTTKNFAFIIKIFALTLLVDLFLVILRGISHYYFPDYTSIIVGISILVLIFFSLGYIKISLKITDGEVVRISDFITDLNKYINFFTTLIVFSLIVFFAFLALFIPGIVFGIICAFTLYIVVDMNIGVVEAMKLSAKLTKGLRMEIFLFKIALVLINLAGLCLFFVGLIFTIPMTMIATAYVYRKLSSEAFGVSMRDGLSLEKV